jgi:hypothetical protein
LPDDLKARMDAVTDVNWSGEAAKCFEKVLGEIAKRKPNQDLADAVARLRASRLESEEADYRAGHDAGRVWALNRATYPELQRAAELDTDLSDLQGGGGFRTSDYVAFAVRGIDLQDGYMDAMDSANIFWEEAGFSSAAVDAKGEDFLRGFLDGAGEIWQAVRAQL